jgi:hypothetical protein
MDITDKDGLWRITDGQIENRKTGEVRKLKNTPNAHDIAFMSYDLFMSKCSTAFTTGEWPKTHWASGNITD